MKKAAIKFPDSMATPMEVQMLKKELFEAKRDLNILNQLVAALVKEKFNGKTFVSISTVAQTEGWYVSFKRLLPLGTVRISCVDRQGNNQFHEDSPTESQVVCDECGKPAVVVAGVTKEGAAVQPKCADHIPSNAKLRTEAPVLVGTEAEAEEQVKSCPSCARKVGHNLDCPNYNAN